MFPFFKTDFKIIFCFLAGCLVCLVPGTAGADSSVLYKGVVYAFKLNVREIPSRSGDVVVVLKKGDSLDVTGEKGGIGGWLTVNYRGKKGYIRNRPKYITLTRVPKPSVVKKPRKIKAKPLQKKKAVSPPAPRENLKGSREKEKIAQKIATETRRMESFSLKEVEILDGLNESDYALAQARIKSSALAAENMALAEKIKEIRKSAQSLAGQMEKNQAYAGRRLNALYRMHMIGSLDISGPPSSVFDFFVKQNAMKQVVKSDLTIIESQIRDLEKLKSLEAELYQQMAVKKELEAELALQVRIREKETVKREAILREIRQKKRLSQAALASLEAAALALDERLASLDKGPGADFDGGSFASQKGRLTIPVRGKIVSSYGPSQSGDYKSFTFQSGIDIKVERGEPVSSVFKGEVLFARWLKGYGNLLIINHGDHYYTLYAHVEEIFKKKGEKVETGEVIATAGDSGSIKGLRLHFEVRHHGKPVNPMKWLKKGV